MNTIERFFKIQERNTTLKTEVTSGIVTFMTMAYVLVVQPGAICGYGPDAFVVDVNGVVISKEAIVVSCALISGLITLLMAFYANLPFALSTGMGSNFMFGALIQQQVLPFGGAMAMTLVSGSIFVVLTAFGIRDVIVKAIPASIKVSIGTAIGFYIAYLGFKNSGVCVLSEGGISTGNFTVPAVWLAVLGLVIIGALTARKVNGAILIGILAITVLGIPFGVTTLPATLAKIPDLSGLQAITFSFDWAAVLQISSITLIFITFCGYFFPPWGRCWGSAPRLA